LVFVLTGSAEPSKLISTPAIPTMGTLRIKSPNHTSRSTDNATGIDDRPAIPLPTMPISNDLPGWRTRLMGEKLTNAMQIMSDAKISTRYTTSNTPTGYRI
jgi:hypothetical protein